MEPRPTVIIVMGVSGSGKTTIGTSLAKQLCWDFQDADWFHSAINIDKMSHGIPLTDEDRQPWLKAMRDAIKSWIAEDKHCILACSALKETYRHELQPDAIRVRFVYLKASLELLMARMTGRQGHFMKADMLTSQLQTIEEPADAIIIDAARGEDEIVAEIRKHLSV